MKQRWYREGLQFECTACGECCSGEPGFVWVDDREIGLLAQSLEMDDESFRKKFVRNVGLRTSLIEYPNGDCIFLHPKTRGCTVYGARPTQCRTWPFWSENVKSQAAWKATCEVCPGAGNGQLYTLEHIETQRRLK